MLSPLESIYSKAALQAQSIESRADFEIFKSRLVGPKGTVTQWTKEIKTLPQEQRPVVGRQINTLKQALARLFAELLDRVESREQQDRLGAAADPTLPSPDPEHASLHPLEQVRREIVALFQKVGFAIVEGSEIETEYFVFDALNIPEEHPARAAHDTYYLRDHAVVGNVTQKRSERYLLRPHTSCVQIRKMLQQSPPLRIISSGRCFRRDTSDATHSTNFHQIEGLYVDEAVTVRDLKAILDYFVKKLLGREARTRFRPHFFPYTEPSFEVDFAAAHLGKVSRKWVEIMGCGLVDPAVFEAVGYDASRWSGFAFGMGIERIAMILYGVDDIRHFY